VGVSAQDVHSVIIWGNHSSTQFPDVRHALVKVKGAEVKVMDAVKDDAWLKGDFISVSQERCQAEKGDFISVSKEQCLAERSLYINKSRTMLGSRVIISVNKVRCLADGRLISVSQ
jgi:hypothetical protein